MKPTRNELPEVMKNLIISHHQNGKSLSQIREMLCIPISTVQSIIKKFSTEGSVQNKPRTGRPKILSERTENWLVRKIKMQPKLSAPKLTKDLELDLGQSVSVQTVRRCLKKQNFHRRVARKKPFISKKNRKARLEFAKKFGEDLIQN
ncbi:uncharacterized protein LOC136094166 [Hydra vulgaris]|uniref:uncharacterized protein LOC136094166 n=1 Tax=Hydra vulgaris TaxID=6087 RepID=UPI0002B438A8